MTVASLVPLYFDFLTAPANDDDISAHDDLVLRQTDLALLRRLKANCPVQIRAGLLDPGYSRLCSYRLLQIEGGTMSITDLGRDVVKMNASVRIPILDWEDWMETATDADWDALTAAERRDLDVHLDEMCRFLGNEPDVDPDVDPDEAPEGA